MGQPSMEMKKKKRRWQKKNKWQEELKGDVMVNTSGDSLEYTHTYCRESFSAEPSSMSKETEDAAVSEIGD